MHQQPNQEMPKPISFLLQKIDNEQFAIIEETNISEKLVSLETELRFGIDKEKQQIGVWFDGKLKQEQATFAKLVVSCHFRIKDESWKILENTQVIPKTFLTHLAMITVGTARGVWFAKTEKTPFVRFIIPTLNVSEMIKDDISFEN